MDDQEINPWKVSKLEDFLYFCCPECNVKDKSKDFFIKHALQHHPKAKDILEKNSEFKDIIENVDSNVNHFSSDTNNEENLEAGSHDSNFEKYLKDEVKIESINVKKHEEIEFYEENKVIYSEEILNSKDSITRTVHENSKLNRCETCGKIILVKFSCKIFM